MGRQINFLFVIVGICCYANFETLIPIVNILFFILLGHEMNKHRSYDPCLLLISRDSCWLLQ